MPLHRRMPKRGFTNIFRVEYTVLGLDRVAELVAEHGAIEFTLEKIVELNLLRKKPRIDFFVLGGKYLTAERRKNGKGENKSGSHSVCLLVPTYGDMARKDIPNC